MPNISKHDLCRMVKEYQSNHVLTPELHTTLAEIIRGVRDTPMWYKQLDSDETEQLAMVACWRALDRIDTQKNPFAYLTQTVINAQRISYRSHKRYYVQIEAGKAKRYLLGDRDDNNHYPMF